MKVFLVVFLLATCAYGHARSTESEVFENGTQVINTTAVTYTIKGFQLTTRVDHKQAEGQCKAEEGCVGLATIKSTTDYVAALRQLKRFGLFDCAWFRLERQSSDGPLCWDEEENDCLKSISFTDWELGQPAMAAGGTCATGPPFVGRWRIPLFQGTDIPNSRFILCNCR